MKNAFRMCCAWLASFFAPSALAFVPAEYSEPLAMEDGIPVIDGVLVTKAPFVTAECVPAAPRQEAPWWAKKYIGVGRIVPGRKVQVAAKRGQWNRLPRDATYLGMYESGRYNGWARLRASDGMVYRCPGTDLLGPSA